jgi:Fe-Mn family superoxide dismutase
MEKHYYRAKDFKISGLKGISDRAIEMHLQLYEGYVKNTNLLNEHLAEFMQQKKNIASDPGYSELKRHLGFEYGGMVLHEYYFGNLRAGGGGVPTKSFINASEIGFGSFAAWKADYVDWQVVERQLASAAATRPIG